MIYQLREISISTSQSCYKFKISHSTIPLPPVELLDNEHYHEEHRVAHCVLLHSEAQVLNGTFKIHYHCYK